MKVYDVIPVLAFVGYNHTKQSGAARFIQSGPPSISPVNVPIRAFTARKDMSNTPKDGLTSYQRFLGRKESETETPCSEEPLLQAGAKDDHKTCCIGKYELTSAYSFYSSRSVGRIRGLYLP